MDLKFLKFLQNKRIKKNNFSINSNIYWYILLFLFFAIIFSGFTFIYINFKKLNKNIFTEESFFSKQNINKKDEIIEILNYFENKKEKLNSISEIKIIDPSL